MRSRIWPFAVAAAIAVPLGLLVYFLNPPLSEVRLDDRVQHFAVTTNVALVAAAVSIVIARSALDMCHWASLLVALGFMSLAGIFAVHGLATPGVLLRGDAVEAAALPIVGLSAQLSLGIPALFFAARYTPIARWLERSMVVTPSRALAATGIALLAYGVFAIGYPRRLGDMVDAMTGYGSAYSYGGYGGSFQGNPGWVIAVAGPTIALLLFAAVMQAREFTRGRLPSQAALSIAYLLLAQTQIAMILGPLFSATFWSYHGLMASAVILALGALVLELPEMAVATVNEYLRAMARAVLDEGAILDKFTGDGLMAIFGAMSDTTAGATAAVRAAVRMRRDLAAINAARTARGEPVIGYGIGMSTGDVVLGAVGLPERSDYTAMGDTVNTAARMEALTKELGTDLVISETTASLLDGAGLRRIGEAAVKGKSASVTVFTI
ncbi:MAG: hypothetical protein HYX56_06635 [Chloroflexi bacterium]|nr:hypothetical protein [Chloroflexota bacterium]